jgi:hypothetical protein
MKNIIVYIAAFVMMMPCLNLSAEIKLRTNDPFNNDDTPFKNSPFAGGNPNEIERNLFAPKRVKVQNKNQYNVDFNHNSRRHENVSYLNREAIHNTSNANMPHVTISANGANNEFQRHNTPLNNNEQSAIVSYNMPTTIDIDSEIGGDLGNIESSDTQSGNNPYAGSGAPSTYGPIGDVVWPLLLLALAYIGIKRRIKQ